MGRLDQLLHELGISKVRLAEYLGVSRQMVYNYLECDDINKWPKEKRMLLFRLLNIKSSDDLLNLKVDADYILLVENTLKAESKRNQNYSDGIDLKGLKKSEQDLLNDIFYLLKEHIAIDDVGDGYNTTLYLYHFLQAMETAKELKYMLSYVSKAAGFTDPHKFVFDEESQFIFEGIQYSAMTLYNNGGASRSKIEASHKRFAQEIELRNEEKLSRTQELNTAKIQALKELGYTEINENNAREVFDKIAEIQSRKV